MPPSGKSQAGWILVGGRGKKKTRHSSGSQRISNRPDARLLPSCRAAVSYISSLRLGAAAAVTLQHCHPNAARSRTAIFFLNYIYIYIFPPPFSLFSALTFHSARSSSGVLSLTPRRLDVGGVCSNQNLPEKRRARGRGAATAQPDAGSREEGISPASRPWCRSLRGALPEGKKGERSAAPELPGCFLSPSVGSPARHAPLRLSALWFVFTVKE